MGNHPNRGRRGAHSNPTPPEIIELRHSYDLTQSEAAELVYAGLRTWQDWESGERRMHPGLWALFQIKVGAERVLAEEKQ